MLAKTTICTLVYFSVCLISKTTCQDRLEIDIESEIPSNDKWIVDCPEGYKQEVSQYDCEFMGSVKIPPDQLSGEVGFWTACKDRCQITYVVQDEDVMFAARIYQNNLKSDVLFDGGAKWEFIEGNGWVEYYLDLLDFKENFSEITLRFHNFADDDFTVLDKIVVNGQLSTPITDPIVSTTTPLTISTETTHTTLTSQDTTVTTGTTDNSSPFFTSDTTEEVTTATSDGSSTMSSTFPISPSDTTEEVITVTSDGSSTMSSTFPISTSEFTEASSTTSELSSSTTTATGSSTSFDSTSSDCDACTSEGSSTPSTTEETPTKSSTRFSSTTSTIKPPENITFLPLPEMGKSFIEGSWLIFLISFLSSALFLAIVSSIFYFYSGFKLRRIKDDVES